MAVQWATVAVLLAALVMVQIYYPEWTGIDFDLGKYRAIDGDSFKAQSGEIRLYGIDAPEYRQTCRDSDGQDHPCGRLARDALSQLIRNKAITCTSLDRDRYGRHVSVCRDGPLDIGREMVKQGWAVAYRRHALDYVSAEREARSAKRGIWAWSFETPEDYRRRTRVVQGGLIEDE